MKKKLLLFTFVVMLIGITPIKSSAQYDAFLGEVKMFAGNFAPRGWAICNGQTLQIASNTALFSILGTTYGGNGTTTFSLPDLQGRVPIGVSNGYSSKREVKLGEKLGQDVIYLTNDQLPSHEHGLKNVEEIIIKNSNDNNNTDSKKVLSPDPTGGPTIVTTQKTGASKPIFIQPPSLAINYIICINGFYPSRD